MLTGLKLETQPSGVVRYALQELQDSFRVAMFSSLRAASSLWAERGRHSQPFRLKMRYISIAAPTMSPIAIG